MEIINVAAPVTGSVWKLLVKVGDTIELGQELAILESMKMEIPIEAEESGTVKEIMVPESDYETGDLYVIHEGETLLTLEVNV